MPNLMLVPDVEAPPPAHHLAPDLLGVAWDLMVSALRARRIPRQDAEDASQQALVTLLGDPDRFAPLLADLNTHGGYFVRMALNEHLMQLRSERRRRDREELHVRSTSPLTAGTDTSPDVNDALALIEAAPLNKRQRAYLLAVLVEHLSIDQLAARTNTSPRAVRGVLQRAVAILNEPGVEPRFEAA